MLDPGLIGRLRERVGDTNLRLDFETLALYSQDALKKPHAPEAVVLPATTAEVAAVVRACADARVPIVPRGAGTGYTGGSVPTAGGIVLSLERLDRILEIDEENLLAVVQPNVVTGRLQEAVERVGLFYPPDPASLNRSVIGGNVAECAGGPRAFKYGTTKRYVLGLEAVLPTGDVVRTGSKTVKNVVGYDLTQLLVGSEGTLAIITEIVLRLVPKPEARATLRATFASIEDAVGAVSALIRARVVPAALELIDKASLDAVAAYAGPLAPAGSGALLLLDVDGGEAAVREEHRRLEEACRRSGATEILTAATEAEREELWRVRRELSYSLKLIAPLKINHDVVVPRGRVPRLFDLVDRIRREHRLRIACFGHAGDGNIHVNIMVDPDDSDEVARAHVAERELFAGVVGLEGSISGEHGIGFAKAPYLGVELSPETMALMARVKRAFDPDGILNPGKIFPPDAAGAEAPALRRRGK